MRLLWSDVHNVRWRSATRAPGAHFEADTLSVPANRSRLKFPRATTPLCRKISRPKAQPSHLVKPSSCAEVATAVFPPNNGALHRDWRFDRWVRVVAHEFEIFEFEIVNVFHCWIQFHPWQRPTIAGKLLASFLEMGLVKVQIAKRVDEIARP